MKKLFGFAIVFLSIIYLYYEASQKEVSSSPVESKTDSEVSRPLNFGRQKLSNKNSILEDNLRRDISEAKENIFIQEAKVLEQYREQVLRLAEVVDKEGLNAESLVEEALAVPREDFLKKLPAPVREEYRKLYAMADDLHQIYLKQDKVPGRFLKNQPDLSSPDWVNKRALELEEVELSKELWSFVDSVREAESIKDSDIDQLIVLCEADRDCIEKAAKEWMDGMHLLDQVQMNRMEEAISRN